MIVVDASAAVSGLLNAGPARRALARERVHVPHLIDAEVANALRAHVLVEQLAVQVHWAALDTWRRLGMIRYPMLPLLERVWELRDNLTAYDACYVALAESLECDLITADARLSRAPGIRCPITLVPK